MKTFLLGFVSLAVVALALGATIEKEQVEETKQAVRLDGFKVYKILVQDTEELAEVSKLGEEVPVHYLRGGSTPGTTYDVAIAPNDQKQFEKLLKDADLAYETGADNLQEWLDRRIPKNLKIPKMEWTQYHTFKEIDRWAKFLPLRHPFSVKTWVIGRTYEGRPIRAVKLSRRPGNKAIYVESNIHAIEWITSAVNTCFMDRLMKSWDPELLALSFKYDWIFVPMANPDGYVYTHEVHPLWRKNRKPTGFRNESGICYGVDLNRNFNFAFKQAGHNVDVPCDHWYAGGEPESEPEILVLTNFLSSLPVGYVRVYIALHSYGQLINLPYSHTTEYFPDNFQQMLNISKGFADAAEARYGQQYLYGTSGQTLYPLSGSGKDWAYAVAGIPYAASIELRDQGTYGFFLPPEEIIPNCDEFTDGMIGLIKAAEAEGIFK